MKKMLCMLMTLLLLCSCAAGEGLPALTLTPTATPQPPLLMVTPTPDAAPAGEIFACEAFIVRLPYGMLRMTAQELEGYEAAVQDHYPDGGATQLLAVDPDGDAMLRFSLTPSAQTAMEAAREAALILLGDAEAARECVYGLNTGACFDCPVDEKTYRFFYFSSGEQLLLLTACDLEESQIAAMLCTLDF